MAYSACPTVATGDLWTASNHNTFIRDNFAAGVPAILQAKGDLVVASSVNNAARLPLGTDGFVLTADASQLLGVKWAEAAGGLAVDARQGGSASDWNTAGTSIFTPDKSMMQCGVVAVSISGSAGQQMGTGAVTFPVAFTAKPLVFLATDSVASSGIWVTAMVGSLTVNGFTAWVNMNGNYTPRNVFWLAIGPTA